MSEVLMRAGSKTHVIQGEHYVSDHPDAMFTTVLGSCVSACLHDPVAGLGGMNHFLLADAGERGDAEAVRYGAYAMEVLINSLLKKGAARGRLQAKVFGGARMFDGLSDVGADNARFIRRFLEVEGIPLLSESLGGVTARRVEFWPATGRARVRHAAATPVEPSVLPRPKAAPIGDVELF